MQRPRKRLTKKDLKEDEMVTWVLKASTYIEKNYPKLLAAVGAVLVAVLIGVFIRYQAGRERQKAIAASGELQVLVFEQRIGDAIVQAERLADEYDGEAVAADALMVLGNLYFDLGRYAEAQASYQRYLDRYGDAGPGAYGAWAGVAACMETQENYDQAAAKYVAYVETHGTSPFAPTALKEASRCYTLAGNDAKAQEVLERIVESYPETEMARSARAELQQLQGI